MKLFITIIVLILFLLVILLFVIAKTLERIKKLEKKEEKEIPEEGKRKPVVEPTQPPLKDYVYLSVFKNYLDNYNISPNSDDAFFILRKKILNDGANSATKKIRSILRQEGTPLPEKAKNLLTVYDDLIKSERKLKFPQAKNDIKSIKIYKEAGKPYIKEFDLEQLAEENLQEAFTIMLSKLYANGEKQLLKKIEQNIQWIKKYLEKQDFESLKKEFDRILDKLSDNVG